MFEEWSWMVWRMGGWGTGRRGFLLLANKWMTSSDSTEENASYSSKNLIGWCWNNWRKGKRGPWVCETARDQRVFFLNTSPFFSIFKKILLTCFHTVVLISRIHTAVHSNPSPPPPLSLLSLLSTWASIPALLLFVCGPEGWIRMSDRKRSHLLTSLFPLPFPRFLELHLILYSAQCVQRPFRLFLLRLCLYITWCSVMRWTL